MCFQTLPGGVWGVSLGSGRLLGGSFAWKTEKLVDSMTCKLPPAPKMSFGPVLRRSGSEISKKFQENPRISTKIPGISMKIVVLSPKMAKKQREML